MALTMHTSSEHEEVLQVLADYYRRHMPVAGSEERDLVVDILLRTVSGDDLSARQLIWLGLPVTGSEDV